MSVYHSIRGSMQPSTVEEDAEDQDGLVVVDLNADPEPIVPAIHPASDRVSGQVSSLHKYIKQIFPIYYSWSILCILQIFLKHLVFLFQFSDHATHWSQPC